MRRSIASSSLLLVAISLVSLASCTSTSPEPGATSNEGLALPGDGPRRVVTVQLADWPAEMRWLREQGFDVAGVSVPLQRADVVVSSRGLAALRDRGVAVVAEKDAAPTPFAAVGAPDAQYQTPASIQTKLQAYAAAHPKTTKLVSLGKSREGRDIWAMEIARDVTTHAPGKPSVLYNGMHHAREVMSSEVPLDTIDYLLANDGKDAKVTHWIASERPISL